MYTNKKSLYLVLIFLLFLVFPLVNVPVSHATASDPKDKALSFLANVVSIDLSKYNVTLVSDKVPYNVVDSVGQKEVRYKLENSKNTLDVTCLFKDNTLVWCTMYVLSGSPVYTQTPSTNLLDQVNALLDKYQNYTESSYIQGMKDPLRMVHTADDATVTLGNVKLVIHSDGLAKGFEWTNTYNGIEAPGLQIEFYDGVLETFNDQGSLFTIGSTAVNVSKEKAISIALNRVKNFSWMVGLDSETAMNVTNFTVLSEPLNAELSMQPREASTLYPFWRVDLYLDKVYAGGVSSIAVGVWADTGEVRYCKALSYGSGPPPVDSLTLPTSSSPQVASTSSIDAFLIAVAAATALSIGLIIVALKKKHK